MSKIVLRANECAHIRTLIHMILYDHYALTLKPFRSNHRIYCINNSTLFSYLQSNQYPYFHRNIKYKQFSSFCFQMIAAHFVYTHIRHKKLSLLLLSLLLLLYGCNLHTDCQKPPAASQVINKPTISIQ